MSWLVCLTIRLFRSLACKLFKPSLDLVKNSNKIATEKNIPTVIRIVYEKYDLKVIL